MGSSDCVSGCWFEYIFFIITLLFYPKAVFSTVEVSPLSHRFNLSLFQPTDPKTFIKFVRKEINLLKTSLPKGIHVKAFEDRMVIDKENSRNYCNLAISCHLFKLFLFQLTCVKKN